jgi:hypothetical protein
MLDHEMIAMLPWHSPIRRSPSRPSRSRSASSFASAAAFCAFSSLRWLELSTLACSNSFCRALSAYRNGPQHVIIISHVMAEDEDDLESEGNYFVDCDRQVVHRRLVQRPEQLGYFTVQDDDSAA